MAVFGLKLGIHESRLAARAETLWRSGSYAFLELYIPADADAGATANWSWYDGPLVLHAPHSGGGFNFSRPEKADSNRRAVELVDMVREALSPEMAVFHPGLDGSEAESLRQIEALRRDFPDLHQILLLENKPYWGLDGERCLGASPSDMAGLLRRADCGFCLDVRHAFAYAAAAGLPWRGVVEELAALEPALWHAADGCSESLVDSHMHIGDGNMPWREIAGFWNDGTPVTIECRKDPDGDLGDFLDDARRLRISLSTTKRGH